MAWTERYARADAAGGGNGTTNTNSGANGAWTFAEASANEAAGMRINIMGGYGGYSRTTTTDTFAAAGTTTAPIWLRGSNTTAGDLDDDHTTAKPAITYTTGRLVVSGAHHYVTNLDVSGAFTTAEQILMSAASCRLVRCRVENTNAAAASSALKLQASPTYAFECYLKATATATRVVETANFAEVHGSYVTGGGNGIEGTGTSQLLAVLNLIIGCGNRGIVQQGAPLIALFNTIRGCGSDGIYLSGVPATATQQIIGNLLASNGGWGINNASGANTNMITRLRNAFYANTSGDETGFGDSPHLNKVTLSVDPFVNAAGGDYSLLLNSLAIAAAAKAFEKTSVTSYLDIGAVQHAPGAIIALSGPTQLAAIPMAAY